jgi:hypothetical protein
MPYEIFWHTDRRIIQERFYGQVTLEEIREITNRYMTLIVDGVMPVHTLVDVSSVTRYPSNLNNLRELFDPDNDPGVGWILICGANNPLLRFLSSILTQILLRKLRMRLFYSIQEALEFLCEQDPTLIPATIYASTGK